LYIKTQRKDKTLDLCCHWPPRLLSHAYNASALRGDIKLDQSNLPSVTIPVGA